LRGKILQMNNKSYIKFILNKALKNTKLLFVKKY